MGRSIALLSFTLLIASPVRSATFHFVSPTGSASWAQSTSSSSPASLATANDSAQAGDWVFLQSGTYAASVAPVNSGVSTTSRIVFLGSTSSPGAATVQNVSLGNASYVSVKWVAVDSSISAGTGAAFDSLYNLTDPAPLLDLKASNSTLSHCAFSGPAILTIEGDCGAPYPCGLSPAYYASNDTVSDCSGSLQHSGSRSDVFLLTLLRYPYFARNHFTFVADTTAADSDGQFFTLKWVIGGRFIDDYWSMSNNAPNSSNIKIAFNLRDSTRSNFFQRDTILAQGAHNGTTTTEILLANSGTIPGTTGANRFDACYIKNAVAPAVLYRDAASSDTLQYCSMISNASIGVDFLQESFSPNFLFRHNAVWTGGSTGISFQPSSIGADCRFVSNTVYAQAVPSCFPSSSNTTTCFFDGTLALVDTNLVYSPGGDSTAAVALNNGGPGNCEAPTSFARNSFWDSPALADSTFDASTLGKPDLRLRGGSFALGTQWADRYVGPFHAVPSAATNVKVAGNGVSTQVVTWTEPLYYVGDNCTFDLRQSRSLIATNSDFNGATQIASGQPVTPGQQHCVSVGNLDACTRYYYAVRLNNDLGTGGLSNSPSGQTRCTGSIEVSCTDGPQRKAGMTPVDAPLVLVLGAPRPNPANGQPIVLPYGIPKGTVGRYSLGVFDVAGRRLVELSAGQATPGYHTAAWSETAATGARVGPGIYFVRLVVGANRLVRALVVK